MKCPIDDAELIMSERQGVEIDYCPTCRGVWLDRGELDKILDRAAQDVPAGSPAQQQHSPQQQSPQQAPYGQQQQSPPQYGQQQYGEQQYGRGRQQDGRQPYSQPQYGEQQYGRDGRPVQRKRKESWLSDILDFG